MKFKVENKKTNLNSTFTFANNILNKNRFYLYYPIFMIKITLNHLMFYLENMMLLVLEFMIHLKKILKILVFHYFMI